MDILSKDTARVNVLNPRPIDIRVRIRKIVKRNFVKIVVLMTLDIELFQE